jgi:large subunit ribosomal protein L30
MFFPTADRKLGERVMTAAKKDSESKTVRVKQVRSGIGHPKNQKATLECLGLGKLGKVKELPANAGVLGMIRTVSHLVEVQD